MLVVVYPLGQVKVFFCFGGWIDKTNSIELTVEHLLVHFQWKKQPFEYNLDKNSNVQCTIYVLFYGMKYSTDKNLTKILSAQMDIGLVS